MITTSEKIKKPPWNTKKNASVTPLQPWEPKNQNSMGSLMNKKNHQGSGAGCPPIAEKRNGQAGLEVLLPRPSRAKGANKGNIELIEKVRQLIAATPEIRTDKVGPVKAAVEQGAYEIDAKKLANILIAKLILDP